MKCGLIDLGSNTIRLTIYEVTGSDFTPLVSKKEMTGLAGYVDDDKLTGRGIEKACAVLADFQKIFENFGIGPQYVFATASLRNIKNTQAALDIIKAQTGFTVDIISGEEEARCDFIGATRTVRADNGLLVDIGGGSTELVRYMREEAENAMSMKIGSLNLYARYVENILPTQEEAKAIKDKVKAVLALETVQIETQCSVICGVGGTIRAVLKLNNHMFSMPDSNTAIPAENIKKIYKKLIKKDKEMLNILLKICPDRIHTIVPGMTILREIIKLFGSNVVMVSKYGVREGYLCKNVIEKINTK